MPGNLLLRRSRVAGGDPIRKQRLLLRNAHRVERAPDEDQSDRQHEDADREGVIRRPRDLGCCRRIPTAISTASKPNNVENLMIGLAPPKWCP